MIFLFMSFPCFVATHGFAQDGRGVSEVGETAKQVKAIEIVGNKTISIATILSKIKTRVGQNYLQNVISDDLKRLYNTGYFSDVRVDRQDYQEGFKLYIYVEEKPIIEDVTFSKTKYIKSKVLRKKLKTQAGQFLDNKDVKDDMQTIKDLYAKKGLTSAEVEMEKFIDDATNKITIHFVIREGYKIRIQGINFYGNASFRDKRLLKVIKTRTKNWVRSGYLKEDVIDEDVERLRSFYEQSGYIDIQVRQDIEKLVQGRINVNFHIDEGKRYSVGQLNIDGNKIISNKEVLRVMEKIEVGGIFSREKLSVDISAIRRLYFDRGYIFASVNDATSIDSDSGKVDVTVRIEEGDLAYINKVRVQGNTRTRDVVIRRELKLYPGDRFDGAKLKRSKDRLNNLGYFEDVSFDIEDTDTDQRKDLVVQVKEAKTGTFSFGGGFSTVDKIVGFIEVEQRNFDFTNWPTFTGGGQQLVLRAETGSSKNNYRLSFTEPWIFDHPVSGGFDLYRSERERENDTGYAYDQKKTGGALRFGKQFNDFVSAGVTYQLEQVDIGNFEDNVSADLLAEEGENVVSTVGFNVARDTRDNIFSPTKGLHLSSGLDVAGGLFGGDKDFYRTQANAAYYIPLKWKAVLELKLRAGIVNEFGDSDRVPIFERFFAGGANSIRGYEERGVGPLDAVTNDPIGGESMLLANIEYTIPLIDFVKFAAFIDSGNVWADVNDFGSGDFKSGTGVGLRIKTPIGPVKLDYGYPLNDEPGEEDRSGKFYFSVSRGF